MKIVGSIIFGFLFIPGSIVMIWWNEGRAVDTAKALEEGAGIVLSISSEEVKPESEGKLVHVSGLLSIPQSLRDDEFNIEMDALKLRRNVEMYQWVEKKINNSNSDDPSNFAYTKEWSSELINSNEFHQSRDYQNPIEFPIFPYTHTASSAKLGVFKVPQSFIGKLKKFSPVEINELDTSNFSGVKRILEEGVQKLYIGDGSMSDPALGDIKVSFEIIHANRDYSIVAKQTNTSFEEFIASNGTTIEMIEPGIHSAENMFVSAQESNVVMTWGLRFFGFMMMTFGLLMVLRPVTATASIIPFLGGLLNLGVFIASGIVSFALSLVVISTAWLFYRPLLGIGLLIVGIGVWYFLNKYSQKEEQAPS